MFISELNGPVPICMKINKHLFPVSLEKSIERGLSCSIIIIIGNYRCDDYLRLLLHNTSTCFWKYFSVCFFCDTFFSFFYVIDVTVVLCFILSCCYILGYFFFLLSLTCFSFQLLSSMKYCTFLLLSMPSSSSANLTNSVPFSP